MIDYNRQSLDSIIQDQLFSRIDNLFRDMGWNVRILKYGNLLQQAFNKPGGEALHQWIDHCPNYVYSALVYKGGAAWRETLKGDLGGTAGIKTLLDTYDDESLHALMTNLAGNDLESVLDAFHGVNDDVPTCFLAYTIKGYGLPFAGHKDNHAGLLSVEQMQAFQQAMNIEVGQEWEPFAGLRPKTDRLRQFLTSAPFTQSDRHHHTVPTISLPDSLPTPAGGPKSTQAGFGRVLYDLARSSSEFADRIVTASPDVTVSTNLGSWVNRRGIFGRHSQRDVFCDEGVVSAQQWRVAPTGQHVELGIAENNLFLLLAAFGLSAPLHGQRLFPIGTLYDPFIKRGLDALNYACYQDARFLLIGTPSGLTLSAEGGSHQSVLSPLIGIGQPGLSAFEPAFVDELAVILAWSFQHMQAEDGGSVYLRLSTRKVEQPQRELAEPLRGAIIDGGYWLIPPEPGSELALVCCGAVTPEALAACHQLKQKFPDIGLLNVTSADRLYANWMKGARTCQDASEGDRPSAAEQLLRVLSPTASLVTILDGHPLTLSWLGSVAQHRVIPMGAHRFGQSGDIGELYHEYELDQEALVKAAARSRTARQIQTATNHHC